MRQSQNFDFLGLKNLSPGQFLESSNSRRYHWILKLLVWLFFNFNFERNCEVLNSKSPCILLNKNINFNKNETESKMKNCTTFCFISYKNRKLKVKLWWVGACERKKGALFMPFILSKGSFFKICVLYQCIVYWIHFQNIHTFTIKKTLLYTIL